jgi:hypothetical protein
VTITGTDFTGAKAVTFGGAAATTFEVESDTQITATTPEGSVGPVDVVVTTVAGSDTLSNGFTYVAEAAEPVISSIDPAVGPEAGGTAVTITGTDFTGLTGVSFGGTAATSYMLDSATQISATTPAGTAGAVDVVVTTEAGSNTLSNGFTYEAAAAEPVISSIDPAVGPEAGGTAVTITGADFAGLTGVSFGGTAATSYTLDSATQISATTPAGTAGPVDVVVTTEAGSDTLSNGFTYEAEEPSATFVFSPEGGALGDAMAGEAYSAEISATGGNGSLTYSLIPEGSLPLGMILNQTTGDLNGSLDEEAEPGDYTFTIQVRDQDGATATATFTITVRERVVTVTDKVVAVPPGTAPLNVDLTAGATGGPFVSAEILVVAPDYAGRISIVNGEYAQVGSIDSRGWYLKFIPNPAYSGPVTVQFRLTSALGDSNVGTVLYSVGYDAAAVAEDTDALVRDFVDQRQGLIASSIQVPGLLDRRRMENGGTPLSGGIAPSASGVRIDLGTSLTQLQGDGAEPSPLNVWIDGTFLALGGAEMDDGAFGTFGMLGVGADYLLSDEALVGVTLQADWMRSPGSEATVTGRGWLVGPYASAEIGNDVFWNASLLYGGSSNAFDNGLWQGTFETRRWMANTSIEGQWHLDEATVLTPRLGIVYGSEEAADYVIRNETGDMIEIEGFLEDELRVDLGAEIAHVFTLENEALLTPSLGVAIGANGLDGPDIFGSLTAGISLQDPEVGRLDGTVVMNGDASGRWSTGLRLGARKGF